MHKDLRQNRFMVIITSLKTYRRNIDILKISIDATELVSPVVRISKYSISTMASYMGRVLAQNYFEIL